MFSILFFTGFTIYLVLAIVLNLLKKRNRQEKLKIAFFHPFCNDGGGGQKVLWCMLQALLKQNSQKVPKISIYSLVKDKTQIFQKTKSRFSIDLTKFSQNIDIVFVPGRSLLIPQKKLTMVFHMILPMIYCVKCLIKHQPDVFYDTTGFASTLFLTKILLPTTKTVAYVHYPFISLDMIQKVKQRKADFNNDAGISNSSTKTTLKLIYYRVIFIFYQLNGYFVDFAQTNSSWTHNHMCKIWKNLNQKSKLTKLFPPCSVQDLIKWKKNTQSKQIILMSLAQFRPQKNHKCQINTLKRVIEQIQKSNIDVKIKLYICGTTRGSEDSQLLQELIKYSKTLNLQNQVDFKVNKPFSQVLKYFEAALIGIHTMEAQHFGISVVEMLAGGLIVVAHNSAGPKEDIIQNQNFLASSQEDYFTKIMNIIKASPQQKDKWIKQNRKRSQNFGEGAFQANFMNNLQKQLGQKIKPS